MQPTFHMSWEILEQAVMEIAEDLRDAWPPNPYNKIVAIARGGLIPATMLSHILNYPIYHVMGAKSYVGQAHTGQTVLQEVAAIPQKAVKQCLFVDDILDTGGTFTQILNKYPDARFVTVAAKTRGVTLHSKKLVVPAPRVFTDDVWVKFPWEM